MAKGKNDKNSKKSKKNGSSDKKYVVVDCVSSFHMRYVVELNKDDPEHFALDTVVMSEAVEFSQKHLDETVVTHRTLENVKDVIKLARKDHNDPVMWTDEWIEKSLITKSKEDLSSKSAPSAPKMSKKSKP